MNRNIFLKRSFSFACLILLALAQLVVIPANGVARGKDSLAPSVIIYDNGPLSSGATSKSGVAAPAGFTWSELSTDNGGGNFSNTTLGAGCQQIGATTNNRCADNFVVPVGQTWTINSVIVFGYQTNSVANPFIGANLRIWNGRPGDAGATIIFGDTTTNRLTTPVDSTWFRVGNTLGGAGGVTPAATNTARKIWQLPLTVSPAAVLTSGNYWVDFQLNGGANGNFTPLLTIPGARSLPGWNGRQFIGTTSTWGDIIDIGEPAAVAPPQPDLVPDVIMEFAFRLDGSVAGAPLIPRQRNMDFDGDNKSDFSVARSPTGGGQTTWITHGSGGIDTYTDFGLSVGAGGDRAVPADYDNDGKTDIAVWRGSEGNWYILQSNGSVLRAESFGLSGDDPSVVGDYNGDGKDDMAVYRPGAGNTQSNFYYRTTAGGGIFTVPFGLGNDIAVGGDFDGDGTADFHVARPGGGSYLHFELRSTAGFNAYPWGLSTDKLIAADFDGDGRSDIAAVRNNANVTWDWYVLRSLTNDLQFLAWGTPTTDFLTPGDYDGDGKADFAVWRGGQPFTQTHFHVKGSSSAYQAFEWGQSTGTTAPDYPVANFAVK